MANAVLAFPGVMPARGAPATNACSLPAGPDVVQFGPFRLVLSARRLEKDGVAVPLGGRALDILAALVARAGEVVSKTELSRVAWPDTFVEDGNLRFHIASLRKAFGESGNSAGYLTTVAGRGYCFTGMPVRQVEMASGKASEEKCLPLPVQLRRIIGAEAAVRDAVAELAARRFITLVGAPGIGKTTLAIRLGHEVTPVFRDGVAFVGLSAVSAARFVLNAVAAAMGRALPADHDEADLISLLRDRQLLLIFDNCEHLIDEVAALAERLIRELPGLSILATSREPLRAEGEYVYHLFPLACPPSGAVPAAAVMLAYSAVELFVERLEAHRLGYVLTDEDAPIVAEICRKLDGIPLAIELAARRVPSLGIKQTATLLDSHFSLLWRGRRTAPPRHQTLSAALDWSYDLLSPRERVVLRRVSVFVGSFTLEAAIAVAAGDSIECGALAGLLADLVAKSLVVMHEEQSAACYRLLDTTRVYALARLMGTEEAVTIIRRHAVHYRDMASLDETADTVFRARAGAAGNEQIGNLRTALQWSFESGSDDRLAVSLAAAAAPLLLDLALPAECRDWAARALTLLVDHERDGAIEMQLQAAYGLALLMIGGRPELIEAAFRRGLEIAEGLQDQYHQLQFWGGLHLVLLRSGDLRGALLSAEHGRACAAALGTSDAVSMAEAMLTVAHHFAGNHAFCRSHMSAALAQPAVPMRARTLQFGYDHHTRVRCMLARGLWLRGRSLAAAARARDAIEDAAKTRNPLAYAISLTFSAAVFFWMDDLASAACFVQRLIDYAEHHGFAPYTVLGAAFEGVIEFRCGRPQAALNKLMPALGQLRYLRFDVTTAWFINTLAECHAQLGNYCAALACIDEALALVTRHGDYFNLPELLRIKGEILLQGADADPDETEACLKEALTWARSQSAPAWEWRAAVSYARFLTRCGRFDEAITSLRSVLEGFAPAEGSKDYEAAVALLARLTAAALPESFMGTVPPRLHT